MEHGVLALGPYATAATEEVLRLWGENIEVLQRFSSDNIFFSYMNAAAGNIYEQVSCVNDTAYSISEFVCKNFIVFIFSIFWGSFEYYFYFIFSQPLSEVNFS